LFYAKKSFVRAKQFVQQGFSVVDKHFGDFVAAGFFIADFVDGTVVEA